MDIEDFEVGQRVTVEDGDQELSGVVESIQLKAGLVDVKIYEPGHREHCLIKAYRPEAVSVSDEPEDEKKKSRSQSQARR
jgi:hypothetical protein